MLKQVQDEGYRGKSIMIKMKQLFLFIFLTLMIMVTTPAEACKKARRKTYTVEMDGFLCEGQKTKYKEGDQVVLYYSLVATDTDYTFIVDGEYYRPDYNHNDGYIIRFTMPDHDVKIEVITRNTMVIKGEEWPPLDK